MKKKNKLMILSLLATMLFAGNVHAEDNITTDGGTSSSEVTVGEVETPVYDVNVSWSNLVFDWTWDANSNSYKWQAIDKCIAKVHDGHELTQEEKANIYLDSNCTNRYNNEGIMLNSTYYVLGGGPALISIEDNSTGVRTIPSISWNSETKYSFTTASYQWTNPIGNACQLVDHDDIVEGEIYYRNDSCEDRLTEPITEQTNVYREVTPTENAVVFNDGIIPSEALIYSTNPSNSNNYFTEFLVMLNVDNTKTINTPTTGDKIGTLTITIDTED